MTPQSALKEAVELLEGRCAAIDKHYARFPDSLDRTMEDTAKAIRTILATLSSQAESLEAMASALENIAGDEKPELGNRNTNDLLARMYWGYARLGLTQYRKTGDRSAASE